jgi:hypothetical protein
VGTSRHAHSFSPARVKEKRWWARSYGIQVVFDESDRVIAWSFLELIPPRPPPDLWRWLRWRLGW